MRKLTIVNEEDEANVIRISDAVAKRLSQSAVEETSSSATTGASSGNAPQREVRPALAQQVHNAPLRSHQEAADGYYAPNFTISALEMQQQKERELAEQEQYWQRRLLNLERTHEKINRVIDEEYKKALTIFDDCRGKARGDLVGWESW